MPLQRITQKAQRISRISHSQGNSRTQDTIPCSSAACTGLATALGHLCPRCPKQHAAYKQLSHTCHCLKSYIYPSPLCVCVYTHTSTPTHVPLYMCGNHSATWWKLGLFFCLVSPADGTWFNRFGGCAFAR